ncbi:hypothetical protein [Azohydromonas aeria]|uniref:hypothetical protein n=1 Tax=Azohydromonas aeria TaxID=2590212 RepID=UPI0012F97D8F|nr:hypothetical protein [Azohydromonas aeria]
MNRLASCLLASAALLGGCSGGSGGEYVGTWVNTKSEKSTLQIERNGEGFIVRNTEPGYFTNGKPETKNLPAMLKDGALQVQIGGFGPVTFMVDKATGNLTNGQAEYKKSK